MRRLPIPFVFKFLNQFKNKTDRNTALCVEVIAKDHIANLLSLAYEKLRTDLLPLLKEELENSAFQSKTEQAFKIGLLSDHEMKCYQLIWLICEAHARNQQIPFSFQTEPVLGLCLQLHSNPSYKEWHNTDGRSMFLLGTMKLLYSTSPD